MNDRAPHRPILRRLVWLSSLLTLFSSFAIQSTLAQDSPPETGQAEAAEPSGEEAYGFELQHEGESSADDFVAGVFTEEITVSVVSVTARIVGPKGELVRDIEPGDLKAKVGGAEVAVTGIDVELYAGHAEAEVPESFEEAEREAALAFVVPPAPPSRQLVIVMQIGGHDVPFMEPSYVRGHQQSLPGLAELIDDLMPEDQVALLSFDVKLKIWSDFTTDHARIKELLSETIGFATPPPAKASPSDSSLVRWIRPGRLEEATSPGEAMSVLAEALAASGGPKDVLYVGWDITGYRGFTAKFQQADATVSVLDVTLADIHLLGAPLQAVAKATGGTYESIFRFPKRGPRRIARTMAGYHTITLDLEGARGTGGRLEIWSPGRDVVVHMKNYFF